LAAVRSSSRVMRRDLPIRIPGMVCVWRMVSI
jgi:hypothetical protein